MVKGKHPGAAVPMTRSSLDPSCCLLVDTVLKDLKISIRRLQGNHALQEFEFHVLERLYYKGNNQHRSALFWRRVIEVRRYGSRLQRINLCNVMIQLRSSFWGPPETANSSKATKGAWGHVPQRRSLLQALNEIDAYKKLVDKALECFAKVYRQLNLNLQTGAFLQLILTITAVVSRLSLLLSELRQVIDECNRIYRQVVYILDLAVSGPPNPLSALPMVIESGANTPNLRQSHGKELLGLDLRTLEVVGAAFTTQDQEGSSLISFTKGASQEQSVPSVSEPRQSLNDFNFAPPAAPVAHREMTIPSPRPTSRATPTEELSTRKLKRPHGDTKAEGRTTGSAKKKKKKRDEIDDIFGI